MVTMVVHAILALGKVGMGTMKVHAISALGKMGMGLWRFMPS